MNILLIAAFSVLTATSGCAWMATEQAKPEVQADEKELLQDAEKVAIPLIDQAVESAT